MDTWKPLNNLPASQRGPLILFVVLFIVVFLLLGLFYLALQINAGTRAYTSGESHWSKGRSKAMFQLEQYLQTGDETAWELFQEGLSVPLADRQARLLLDQGHYKSPEVHDYFVAGRNHPDDVPMMIQLYRWFPWQENFARAIDIWVEADEYILQLQSLGEDIRSARERGAISTSRWQDFREQLRAIEGALNLLEQGFSAQIAESARRVQFFLVWLLVFAGLFLVLLGGHIIRRITTGIFAAEERFRKIFEEAPIGIVQISLDGVWTNVNTSMCRILGRSRGEIVGAREENFVHPMDLVDGMQTLADLMASGVDSATVERLYKCADGNEIWVNQTLSLLRDFQGRPLHYLCVAEDVTESRRLAHELSHRARHDELTGLINRYEFERRLNNMIERTADEGIRCALLYLDLDQFKVINDTCGHMAGDAMLAQISTVIRSCLREQDTLARLGGDEFGILLEACPASTAEVIAEKVRSAVTTYRFEWDGRAFSLGISIGVVPFVGEGPDSARLLSAADTACYAAKEAGRNQIQVAYVEDAILHRQQHEMRWVDRLQQALADNRFSLVWQPILPIEQSTDKYGRSFEVLLRMQDESGEQIMPGFFLPAAERYGQIAEIDRRSIGLILDWLEDNTKYATALDLIFINISGASLGNSVFLAEVYRKISESPFPPERLCFEITETMAILNMDAALLFMKKMASLGCKFALDDFGIGVSSFAYLNSMPVDFVKIDGSFVCDIDRDQTHASIVKCINDVAQSMGKQTIAEHVESEAVRDQLLALGVDYVQGWAMGAPVALGETRLRPGRSLSMNLRHARV